jgi:hypothetical protein
MGLGVLEDRVLEHVPGKESDSLFSNRPANDGIGTAYVLEDESRHIQQAEAGVHLKKDSAGTILVPQPSDDPNDPLVRGTGYSY